MSAAREAVIGLEIHVQLATRTKMFCGNAVEFGAAPNTHVCPVCLALPGALPVVNRRAVELGVRAAVGLRCRVHPSSVFVRKSYFYPDLPKGYQITQHDRPLATGGEIRVGSEARRVRIRRVHLEEDTGKSLHDRIEGATALDLNRAGVPLIEIVTEPDLRSPAEARELLTRLKQVLQYLEVGDCDMEKGGLRVDANVSLRRPDGAPGVKTEVKNLNSFGEVERALRFEIERQGRILERGGGVESQTLLWDAGRGEARPMRSKEELHDYRYFAEPDLPPLTLDTEWLAGVQEQLPEMPWERSERLERAHGLARTQAESLTATRDLADYFEAVVAAGADGREAASWVLGELLAARNSARDHDPRRSVPPAALAELLGRMARGELSRGLARTVFERMVATGEPAARIVREEGLAQVSDQRAVERWVEEVLQAHPDEVTRYRAGEVKLLGFLMGGVMRASGGRADPHEAKRALRNKLDV